MTQEDVVQWGIALALAVSAGAYVTGVARLWQRAGQGVGIGRWHAAAFAGALLTLAVALESPLVQLAALAFAPHMIQHELLMLIAAPLLVIGNPFVAFAWALPEAWRPAAVQGWRRGGLERASVTLTRPIVAFLVHGAVLWAWHAPALFNGAMANALVHAGQHLTFTGTAVLFWWGLLHGRYGRLAHGAGVVFVFLTAVHSSLLGALLTLAPTAWYRPYVVRMNGSAADALSDQQLAGLLMWIPSAVFFIAAGLLLTSLWIRAAGTRSVSRPAAN